jgi:hypothetical protein
MSQKLRFSSNVFSVDNAEEIKAAYFQREEWKASLPDGISNYKSWNLPINRQDRFYAEATLNTETDERPIT